MFEMMNPQGEALKVGFDGSLKFEFHGAKVTLDAGLLAYRDLDEALGLFDLASKVLNNTRNERNIQHDIRALLRQSVYMGPRIQGGKGYLIKKPIRAIRSSIGNPFCQRILLNRKNS